MLDKVLATIRKYNMIEAKDHVIVGLSGGVDSVCLLWTLNQLKEILGIQIYAIHVHHGLRGVAADEDAKFSEALCEGLTIPIEIVYRNINEEAKLHKISEEEAGRKARYACFYAKREALGSGKIAVGHHMNDQAETILFNMMRGSGLKGLSGISPIRGVIIRPLIDCTRLELEDFCREHKLPFVSDLTNELERYTRNKIRLNLIPYIEQNFNPSFIKQMSTMGEQIREEDAYLDNQADYFIRMKMNTISNNIRSIAIDQLIQIDKVIRKRVYRKIIFNLSLGLKDYESKHMLLIDALLNKETGKKISLPYGIIVEREYNELYFKTIETTSESWEYLVDNNAQAVDVKEINGKFEFKQLDNLNYLEISQNKYTKWFDYDKIKCNLTIRNRRTGDFICLNGINGKKKLKDYFIDEKISRDMRNKLPLLTDGSHVIWIVGLRISEQYKVSKDTKRILEVNYIKED
ncbi:MAG: tRNA lysidine(34) synthetase TilS [Firmicutes bacterium HGW-Firmicutes-7]|nr:MAG: tRNA lysidine(34) synthetase TilS [Firmicutes bacterium HGW-Firmicutes-7]